MHRPAYAAPTPEPALLGHSSTHYTAACPPLPCHTSAPELPAATAPPTLMMRCRMRCRRSCWFSFLSSGRSKGYRANSMVYSITPGGWWRGEAGGRARRLGGGSQGLSGHGAAGTTQPGTCRCKTSEGRKHQPWQQQQQEASTASCDSSRRQTGSASSRPPTAHLRTRRRPSCHRTPGCSGSPLFSGAEEGWQNGAGQARSDGHPQMLGGRPSFAGGGGRGGQLSSSRGSRRLWNGSSTAALPAESLPPTQHPTTNLTTPINSPPHPPPFPSSHCTHTWRGVAGRADLGLGHRVQGVVLGVPKVAQLQQRLLVGLQHQQRVLQLDVTGHHACQECGMQGSSWTSRACCKVPPAGAAARRNCCSCTGCSRSQPPRCRLQAAGLHSAASPPPHPPLRWQ